MGAFIDAIHENFAAAKIAVGDEAYARILARVTEELQRKQPNEHYVAALTGQISFQEAFRRIEAEMSPGGVHEMIQMIKNRIS